VNSKCFRKKALRKDETRAIPEWFTEKSHLLIRRDGTPGAVIVPAGTNLSVGARRPLARELP
jgi:hypothetical protein